ncbi:hypothetical protein [Ferruginibacter sp.]|nr:hypothetical protein [Ferruginibacter sp.]
MLHYKKKIGFLAGLALLFLTGCYKDKTVIIDTTAEITRAVSFTGDIVPIFNKSCNGSGCHAAGGIKPDLSVSNAHTALTNGNYFNITTAESSSIYQWMAGKKGTPMPTSGVNKDYNALVLAWIKQGAKNN